MYHVRPTDKKDIYTTVEIHSICVSYKQLHAACSKFSIQYSDTPPTAT